MSENRFKIKAIKKAPTKIKIKRKMLSTHDLKVLTQNILRLNSQVPLQQTTLQDVFDKTAFYMNKLQHKRTGFIKIKKVRLFNKAN
jgi:hypothetical protein